MTLDTAISPLSEQDVLASYGRETIQHFARFFRWHRDPYAFLTEACYTKDEVAANPGSTEKKDVIRLIPQKEYIEFISEIWHREDRLTFPKSRRMIMTWILTGLELRLCLYHPVTIHIYAQDQTSAESFVWRHKFMYERLPLPSVLKPKLREWRGKEGNPSKLVFPSGATIEAFPGTPDAVRGEGCTVARLEEFAFWKWPEQSWKAILPTVMGGGKLVVVSTPQANTLFKSLVFDEMGVI